MSTLQVALAIAGGVVLAGVVAHSAWSSRKSKPRQADPLPGRDDQGGAAPNDPALDAAGLPAAAAAGQRVDPADFDGVVPVIDRRPIQDALIDVLAPIELDSPTSGDAALAAFPATRRVGSKLFTLEGVNAASGEWEQLRAGQRYSAFQAGVQLANRMGALNEIEFSEFVVKTQAFADAVDGVPEFPEMLEEVSRARELDQPVWALAT